MPGFLSRSSAAAALVGALAAGCGSEATKSPSIAAGSSIVAPTATTTGTETTSPPTSATGTPPPAPRPGPRPGPPPEEQCQVEVASWFPDREVLTVSFGTSVPAANVLARATDSTTATNSTSMTDIHGKGSAQLKVARGPVGRPVQVDISVAGGAKACSTTFEVTNTPILPMHGEMP